MHTRRRPSASPAAQRPQGGALTQRWDTHARSWGVGKELADLPSGVALDRLHDEVSAHDRQVRRTSATSTLYPIFLDFALQILYSAFEYFIPSALHALDGWFDFNIWHKANTL